MEIEERGHWTARASGNDHVLMAFVESDDFTHDVRLYVNGDFASMEERFAYAEEIARRLNSWAGAAAEQLEAVKRILAQFEPKKEL